jgi:16S rRNA (guanine966-N2)-methyltransferase
LIRITGGEFRGRIIKTPKGEKTRPTQARLRQALFNSLQAQIGDARVLDLFAGSGALAFEALSWGASSALLVELARPVVKLLESNAHELGLSARVEVLQDSVEKVHSELIRRGPFQVILADPPYAGGWEIKLLESLPWKEILVPGGVFCLEWGAQKSQVDELPQQVFIDASSPNSALLVKIREKNYGDSILTTYQYQSG